MPANGKDTDAERGDLRATGLSTAILAEALWNLPSRRIVLIIDACQSGGAIEAVAKIGSVKARVERWRIPPRQATAGMRSCVRRSPDRCNHACQRCCGPPRGRERLSDDAASKKQCEAGEPITIGQVASYLTAELPKASMKLARGFAQVPLISSIGVDFVVASN